MQFKEGGEVGFKEVLLQQNIDALFLWSTLCTITHVDKTSRALLLLIFVLTNLIKYLPMQGTLLSADMPTGHPKDENQLIELCFH